MPCDLCAIHIYIAPMNEIQNRNVFGAFALMVSDEIIQASSSQAPQAPQAGPTASALALLAHMPGLSIRMLSVGVGLSHAGTVRLVDRLATEGLIERRDHSSDGRTRSLFLTEAGKTVSVDVLNSRDRVIAEALAALTHEEVRFLGDISARVLRARLESLEHSYRVCRLCCYEGCPNCPIDAELRQRGIVRGNEV